MPVEEIKLKCKWYQFLKCLIGLHIYIYRDYRCVNCRARWPDNRDDPKWTRFINGKIE